MRLSSTVLRSLLLGSTAAMAAPLWAQTEQEQQAQAQTTANPDVAAPELGEEILVTATKRASRVQDVPFSINAQTQKDIQRANASTIEEISRNVAGLAVQNLGPGQSQVTVRGVSAGQIVRDQAGVKEQVGVYLDGIGHFAVAVHAGLRPVRPQPRRNPARAAGDALRLGLGRRHRPIHYQPAKAGRHRGAGRSQRRHGRRRRLRLAPQGRDQHADRRDPRPPGGDLRDGLRGIYRCTWASQRQECE